MHNGSRFGFFSNQRVVRGVVGQQRALVVVDAVLPQGAAALACFANADDTLQRIVGAAGGGQQGIAGAQQTKQGDRQGVGAAHELRAHKGSLGAHAAGEDLLQLITAVVPDAVAAGTPEVPGLDTAIGEGTQHFQLVVVADLLHMAERFTTKFQSFSVQFQHVGA